MVARKYLCSAPHPDTWDDRAAALLKSLGGDKAQRRRILRQTLDRLDTQSLVRKEVRPGRKTHAEHAVAFYQHVLDLNERADDENEEKVSEGETKTEEEAAAVEETKPPDHHHRGHPPKRKRVDEESILSMDSEEFRNEHNDLCEVCNDVGELICCSTCNLVFHLECIRPPTTRLPPDHWSCAYCVAQGVKGHPKEARTRRRAKQAAKEMTRLKRELEDSTEGNVESEKPKAKGGDTKDYVSQKEQSEETVEVRQKDEPPAPRRSPGRKKKTPPSEKSPEQQIGAGDEKARSARSDEDLSPALRQGPGGPRKTSPIESTTQESKDEELESEATKQEMSESATPATGTDVSSPPSRREPGRPRRTQPRESTGKDQEDEVTQEAEGKQEQAKQEEDSAAPASEDPPKRRGPGGLRKHPVRAGSPTVDESEPEAKKQKVSDSVALAEEQPTRRGPGRPRKKPIESTTPGSAGTGPEDDDDDGQDKERPRRPRRQPTLYNPQAGAASQWQSDGIFEWKSLGDEHGVASDNDSKTREDDDDASEKSAWCKFCNDDPSVSVCCFCACRICFGKHDAAYLLICDECDSEYHTYCLDPPLSSVPNSMNWFCPSCDPETRQAKMESPSTRSKSGVKTSPRNGSPDADTKPPVRRGPGRPPKSSPAGTALDSAKSDPPRKRGPGRPPKKQQGSSKFIEPVRRGPGRPRKRPVDEVAPTVATKSPNGAPPKKRGPGRPRKHPLPEEKTAEKRISPPKSSVTQKGSAGVMKRPRGRPRRNPSPFTVQGNGAMPLVTPASMAVGAPSNITLKPRPVKSKSGRPIKRSSFHDEIDEGEQHLKILRAAGEPPQNSAALVPQDTGNIPFQDKKMLFQTSFQGPQVPYAGMGLQTPGIGRPSLPGQVRTPATATMPGTVSLATPGVASLPSVIQPPASMLSGVSDFSFQFPTPLGPGPQADASSAKVPRRKPGARECMQISRRFGAKAIPQKYMDTLLDYCFRGKVEHLIRMRERLDDHSRMLEAQLAGLEALVKEKGELDITVPPGEPTAPGNEISSPLL